MTLLLRAIVRESDAHRIAGHDLVAVPADGLAALASVRDERLDRSAPELRAHERITRLIHDEVPSLPARFGELFADQRALANALRSRGAALSSALEDVGARVEVTVTLAWRTPRAVATGHEPRTGRDYLEARSARERERREAEQVVARLVDGFPGKRAFIRQSICPRDGLAAIVAILAMRDEVSTLRRSVGSFAERSSEVSAVVYGPLPPYSFVS
jgi:hypothetical protein